jgi:periplasmic protein TonB
MKASSLKPVPTLGRFVPRAVLLAVSVHILVLGAFLFLSPSTGGGGGQVLGHLSVSLGGSGAAGLLEREEAEPFLDAPVAPPPPRVELQQADALDRPAQKPRVAQVEPVHQPPSEVPSVAEPIVQRVDVRSMTGDAGDGNPADVKSAGAPTLGQGATADRAGIGAADAAPGDQRDTYLALIRARIEQNRTYPAAARRRRDEGMAVMKITIDGQGRLADNQVITGSGSFHLDRAAKRMVEKSAPFPLPPVAPFTTTIPIVFAFR